MASSSFSLENIFDLKGRIALITGGGTGIGWMIAQGLATNGAKVYITGRRKDVLERAVASFKGNGTIIPLVMDVTSRESISAAQKVVQNDEGRLHILVNNAGQVGILSDFFNNLNAPEHESPETLGRALFENESFEEWAHVYTINSSSIFFVTTAFLGLLAKGGVEKPGYTSAVVNISSISGHMKLAQEHFGYNSSKAAAAHLTKLFATEFALKKLPIRVNGVAPGVFPTEMTVERLAQEDGVNVVGFGLQPVPADRAGTFQEMAGTVIYLVSSAGCYTTGQEIIVDGGFIAVNPSRV